MTQQNRTTLKDYFKTGKRPTQEQFAELLDSSLNLADNDLYEDGGNLGLGHDQPHARLAVNGNLSLSPNNDSAPGDGLFVHGNVGIGAGFSNPTAQLAVNGGVYIGDIRDADPGTHGLRVDGNVLTLGNLVLSNGGHVAAVKVRAADNSGLRVVEAGGRGLTIRHRSGIIETDNSLKIGDGKSLFTDKIKARDNTGLRFCEDGGKGLSIADATADLSADGNLTLADGKHLATDKVKARDRSGLRLFAANDKGLTIAGADGDASFAGNVTLADRKRLKTDKVQARDATGVRLAKRDGAVAMRIHDDGKISLGTDTSTTADVNVDGDLEANSLRLTGGVHTTGFEGHREGNQAGGDYILDVPDNKVVTGIKFQRWRRAHGDKDFYIFALRYK